MKTKLLAFLISLTFFLEAKSQYTISTPVTGLAYPVAFTFTPDGRYLITLKSGTIRAHDANGTFIGNFYDLADSTYDDFERGLLGICIDPDYATNKYVYAYYNHLYPKPGGSEYIRVVRFTDVNNVGTNPTIILNIPISGTINGNHVGGNIRFRPSQPDKLYVAIGEIAVPANAQVLTNPFGKFLRINSNGTIPTNNPFYDDGNPATGNDDRIWSWGHRNPFDFTFGSNDSLYSTENGANAWDEVNVVTRGKNYGWRNCEGNFIYNSSTTLCQTNFPTHEEPIHVFGAPLPAVTGILFYTSTVIPELTNHLLVADNDRGIITNLTLNAPALATVSSASTFRDMDQLTTLMQGSEGCIYAMKGGYTDQGNITRICPQSLGIYQSVDTMFALSNTPNPFNGTTRLDYTIKTPAHVKISVYDSKGKIIKDLVDEQKPEGSYSLAVDASKLQLQEGTYLCSMQLNKGGTIKTIKLVVIP